MNVRKLMARLNVPTIRYDAVRGGAPELTSQDIAGALGMLNDPLAREVLCACWWPDGAQLRRSQLEDLLRQKMLTEYSRRSLQAQMAKLEFHIAESGWLAKHARTEHDRRELSSARTKMEAAKAEQWPWNVEVYHRIVAAVIEELRSQHACPHCAGRGVIVPKTIGAVATCTRCHGLGQAPLRKTARAKALGITESAYRSVWAGAYEWTYALISDLERDAARSFSTILGEQPYRKVA